MVGRGASADATPADGATGEPSEGNVKKGGIVRPNVLSLWEITKSRDT